MKKIVLTLIICTTAFFTKAQYNWDFGAHLGASNYLGEMGGKGGTRKDFIYDMKLSKTQFAVGGFARYKISQLVSANLGLNWIRVEGSDNASTNPGRVGRNLSFTNDLIELSLTGQVFFYTISDLGHTYKYKNDFRMYAFAGVGGFYSNPKTYYKGEWVKLQPLETEGKHYSKFNLSIPAGLGFYFTYNKQHRIGWEFNWRTTFTDYIDDVSGNYADPATLSSPEAIALANRRGEIGDQTGAAAPENYIPGSKRGDPSHKDSYISTSVYYSYVLRGRSNFYKSKYGSIFKKAAYKKRRVRAKF